MLIEIFNTLLLSFLEIFEELNNDNYPKNYIEIDGELVIYG